MNFRAKFLLPLIASTAIFGGTQTALADGSLVEAIKNGKIYFDERYRYEFVKQDGIPNDAKASTLRNRIGYKTAPWYGFLFLAEWENVMNIGNDRFNNTINGKGGQFPIVADVESHELNQLFIQYTGIPDTKLKIGRQVIVVDNMRFVGHIGWRQNNQTFDAVTLQNKSIPGLTLTYHYIDRVNRIFGNQSINGNVETETHLFHAAYKLDGIGTLKGYDYLLDNEPAFSSGTNAGPRVSSSNTWGLSFGGKQNIGQGYGLHYYAEYAMQEDAGDNTASYEADYFHGALAVSKSGLKVTLGYEVLGSDNGVGFTTPLATGHIFNGFADQFLNTPGAGLEDFYVDVTYKFKGMPSNLSFLNGLLLKAQYHEFQTEVGSLDIGTEFDFFVKMPLGRGIYAEAKYANFSDDSSNIVKTADVEKFTFGLGWKY